MSGNWPIHIVKTKDIKEDLDFEDTKKSVCQNKETWNNNFSNWDYSPVILLTKPNLIEIGDLFQLKKDDFKHKKSKKYNFRIIFSEIGISVKGKYISQIRHQIKKLIKNSGEYTVDTEDVMAILYFKGEWTSSFVVKNMESVQNKT